MYSVQHSSRDAQAGTFLSMLVKTAGLRVGFATILAPKVSLSGVDNHVLFQAGSTRETLAAYITTHQLSSHNLHQARYSTTVTLHMLEHATGLGKLSATLRTSKLFLPSMDNNMAL